MVAMITCPSCGFAKNPPGSTRCGSCGAELEALDRRFGEADARRQVLRLSWLAISFAVLGALTAIIVFALPTALKVVDFEGGNGMALCIPVWFAGGLVVGFLSRDRAFIEPVVACIVVAAPTTLLLVRSQTVRTMPTFLYVIMATIGVMFSLIGAYVGERLRPRASAKVV